MNLCSDSHDEVCYESRYCPVCAIRTDLTDELKDATAKIESLEADVDALKDQVADLRSSCGE